MWWCGRGEAERGGGRQGTTVGDDDVCGRERRGQKCGRGGGTKERGRKCRHGGGHEGDRGRGADAEADTKEQGKDRSTGAEAGTDRGGSERRHGRAGGRDSMTGSKHKLIREEKRKRKRKRERKTEGWEASYIYKTRPSRQGHLKLACPASSYGMYATGHNPSPDATNPRDRVTSSDHRTCAVTGDLFQTETQAARQ